MKTPKLRLKLIDALLKEQHECRLFRFFDGSMLFPVYGPSGGIASAKVIYVMQRLKMLSDKERSHFAAVYGISFGEIDDVSDEELLSVVKKAAGAVKDLIRQAESVLDAPVFEFWMESAIKQTSYPRMVNLDGGDMGIGMDIYTVLKAEPVSVVSNS